MDKNQTWQDRLNMYIDFRFNGSMITFCEAAGMSERTLKKYLEKEHPDIKLYLKWLSKFPDLDAQWLSRGVPDGLVRKYTLEDQLNDRLDRIEASIEKLASAVENTKNSEIEQDFGNYTHDTGNTT